jgi:phospholipid/cholesterol/gamma-HCH transport system substrate-binding protein
MNYKIKHTKPVVITFVIIPALVLILALIAIAIRQNLFVKKLEFYTTLQNATGISTQTPILYKGFEIGRIKNFELSKAGNIRIEFYVLETYTKSMVDPSVILRQTNPVTSKTTLELIPDPTATKLLKEGATLPCTDFPDGKALLKQISPAHSDPISGIIEDVAYLTKELGRDQNPDAGTIFRILYNAANATEKVDASLIEMQSIMAELNRFMVNMNRDNNADQGALFRILANMADITSSIESQMGEIESIMQSANIAARNYSNPDSLVVRMIDPGGDQIIKPLSNVLVTLNASLREAQSILQVANRNNPEILMMINNLNETMARASQTLEALNNNPILRGGITTTQPKASTGTVRISDLPGE